MLVHAVIGLIFDPQGKILIAQRLAHQAKAGYWEFPGGKVEEAESALAALKRELREEIGIDVLDAEPFMQFEHHYPHASVLLDTWLVKTFQGSPQGVEGQPIRWISPEEFDLFQFPEGNLPIIKKIKSF